MFQPYSVVNARSITVNESNDIGLNIQGPQKWGKQGFIKEEKQPEQLFVKPAVINTNSISSSQMKQQNSISSGEFKTGASVFQAGGVTQSYSVNAAVEFTPQIHKPFVDPKEAQK